MQGRAVAPKSHSLPSTHKHTCGCTCLSSSAASSNSSSGRRLRERLRGARGTLCRCGQEEGGWHREVRLGFWAPAAAAVVEHMYGRAAHKSHSAGAIGAALHAASSDSRQPQQAAHQSAPAGRVRAAAAACPAVRGATSAGASARWRRTPAGWSAPFGAGPAQAVTSVGSENGMLNIWGLGSWKWSGGANIEEGMLSQLGSLDSRQRPSTRRASTPGIAGGRGRGAS